MDALPVPSGKVTASPIPEPLGSLPAGGRMLSGSDGSLVLTKQSVFETGAALHWTIVTVKEGLKPAHCTCTTWLTRPVGGVTVNARGAAAAELGTPTNVPAPKSTNTNVNSVREITGILRRR
jgi:hypothetical protein